MGVWHIFEVDFETSRCHIPDVRVGIWFLIHAADLIDVRAVGCEHGQLLDSCHLKCEDMVQVAYHRGEGHPDCHDQTHGVVLLQLDLMLGDYSFVTVVGLSRQQLHVFAEHLGAAMLTGWVPQAA